MMKKKTAMRALLSSVLALILCVTMLIGTTYAWFTDSVTSGVNTIQSGNLDVVLEYKTDWSDDWAVVDENTKVFDETALYEPGYTEIVFLRVSNAGSLALKYVLKADVLSEKEGVNVYGEKFKLSDYLQLGYYVQDEYSSGFNYADILMPSMFGTREAALSSLSTPLAKLEDAIIRADAPVEAGDTTAQVVALVLTMPEEVGNEANHKANDTASEIENQYQPQINLGLSLVATQYTVENDSFDNQYDKDATYPVVSIEELTKVLENGGNNIIQGADLALVPDTELLMEAKGEIAFDGNGKVITAQGTGTKPGAEDYGYVGFIPAKGEDAVVNNVTVTGSGFVEVGHYGTSTNGNYTVNNMVIKDLKATLAVNNGGNNIAAAFSHYGKATLTDCVMTGTTTLKDGFKPYDAAFVNGTTTTIDGGEYGKVYLANQAKVTVTDAKISEIDSYAISTKNLGNLTIGEGAKIGTINLYDTGSYKATLTIAAGAEVGAIVYNGDPYTQAEWMAR